MALCAVSAAACAVAAHAQQVLLFEDFQGYADTGELVGEASPWSLWDASGWGETLGPSELGTDPMDAANRTFYSDGGGIYTNIGVNISDLAAQGLWLELSFRMFDAGYDADAEAWASGREFAHIRTGADPLLALGLHQTADGLDHYQFRVTPGANWINMPDAVRLEGWNEFRMVVREDTVDVWVNDLLVLENQDRSGQGQTFDILRLGSNLVTNTDVHYDNVLLQTVPEPATYAVIFGVLALAGAWVLRRRRAGK